VCGHPEPHLTNEQITLEKPRKGGVVKRILFLAFLVLLPGFAMAGEGGTSHVLPGATATPTDLPGTSPAWFVKPMSLNDSGNASARIPTAAEVTTNLDATANTLAIAVGRTFEQTVEMMLR
jgi:hypothetical protein